MGSKTEISWTDATWNPLRGCTKVSPGCVNCYAETMASRFCGEGQPYEGVAKDGKWTGEIKVVEKVMDQPLRWRKPRRIFVNSMSDLFHEKVSDATIWRIFEVMAQARDHTFQVLTKRPERMRDWMKARARHMDLSHGPPRFVMHWPPANVWLGVSVENQAAADERIPLLLQTPAAVRFVSCEPLLGPVDLSDALGLTWEKCGACGQRYPDIYWAEDAQWKSVVGEVFGGLRCPACFSSSAQALGLTPKIEVLKAPLRRLDWVIVGGESGHGARPMHPDWARSLRDQCADAKVPFLFKQWGEWLDFQRATCPDMECSLAGAIHTFDDETEVIRVGKKRAGCELDGQEHHEFPAAR